MPWKDPEKWAAIPIIGAMLGIFWKSVDTKKKTIDNSLEEYVEVTYCEMKQENMTLRLERVITDEIGKLKDETLQHMRDIETAIQAIKK